ncbi:MAG: translational GTPase TypA [Candidatus Sumerlaeia bacterium]|nr:translational GTPase TypA [Candidatus Sumerlaeia bacterium]
MQTASTIRNIAIIAHIDHGKTTLIDSIFRAAHTFSDHARVDERVMDNNALEKERGITIRAKHCAVAWSGYRINIVDTPGHADFSGEVERVLSTVDSVLLLVDANEGPMPQTRYVTMRALRLGMRPIVVVNKVDRPSATPKRALDKTFDLFLELGATDEQADFPVIYGSGLNGWFVKDLEADPRRDTMDPLFEAIIEHVHAPEIDERLPFRMQITALGWDEYIGRLGCGRVLSGTYRVGQPILRTVTGWKDGLASTGEWSVLASKSERCSHLWKTQGIEMVETEEAAAGDIVWMAMGDGLSLGDTISAPDFPEPALEPLEIEAPTVSMNFMINSGPFAGRDGKPFTLRQLKERLDRELRTNIALRVEEIPNSVEGIKVSGRGELHLGILIEEMRREGIELCVSRPEVITRTREDGSVEEPMEEVVIDVPDEHQGIVIEKLARRKGELSGMHNEGNGTVRLEFSIPTRGLIGYRGEFLTDTRGLGIMTSRYIGYGPYVGPIPARNRGAMVSREDGDATSYALENLQERGTLFVAPGEPLYEGMIIGEHSRPDELPCNPAKRKGLTNHRSSTKDVDGGLDVPRKMSLDQALEWIAADELVEVTPTSIRLRKTIRNLELRQVHAKKVAAMAGSR